MHFRECSLTLLLEKEPVFCRLVLLINRGKAVCDVWESPPKSHTFSSICFSLGFDPLVCMCCGYWEWTGKFMRSLTWWALLALCIRFHHFMANRWGNSGNWLTLFFWAPKSLQTVIAAMKLKDAYSLGRKVMTNLDSILKSRDITLSTKVHLVKAGFSSGHVWMWELDCKESWAPKNWCFWTVVLEKTLESPLDCKKI